MQNFEDLFGVTLGAWKKYPMNSKSKENDKPVCLQPHSLPKVYIFLKKEVEFLVLLGLLENKITTIGEPHILKNQNGKQIKYILLAT